MTKWHQGLTTWKKIHLEPNFTLFTQMNSRWMIYLNIKVLEETTENIFFHKFKVEKGFPAVTHNLQKMKINLTNMTLEK